MSLLWCNGKWLAAQDFHAAPLDRGAILGLGLFETLLAMNGKAVFCERHLERLAAGCARLGWMAPQQQFADLPEAMVRLLDMVGLTSGQARLRLTVSAGTGPLADLASGGDRVVWMTASPLAQAPVTVAVNIAPWPRNERGALTGLKCASYAENLLALDRARRGGFDETLFFNTADELCEAATGNVFIVRDGRVITPPLASGCLAGITRRLVLELAAHDGMPCGERVLGRAELDGADEVFVTSATRGPVMVARVGERRMDPPCLGPRIRRLWEAQVRRNILA